MALHKLKDFDPNYRDADDDIKGLDVYTESTNEMIGTVRDVLVDQEGKFRYLVVELGFWILGKKVLLPVALSQINLNAQRIYANLSREQAEDLPEYHDHSTTDHSYEEQVRGVYRPPANHQVVTEAPLGTGTIHTAAPVSPSSATSEPRNQSLPSSISNQLNTFADRQDYNYQQDPDLYEMNEQAHGTLKLYEERLIASKRRLKAGEVVLGKHIETEVVQASVSIEKERVVIERTTSPAAGTVAPPSETNFREGEITQIEVYEEIPNIHKEAFVREQINLRKEVQQATVEVEETVRREVLDVETEGQLTIDRSLKDD